MDSTYTVLKSYLKIVQTIYLFNFFKLSIPMSIFTKYLKTNISSVLEPYIWHVTGVIHKIIEHFRSTSLYIQVVFG